MTVYPLEPGRPTLLGMARPGLGQCDKEEYDDEDVIPAEPCPARGYRLPGGEFLCTEHYREAYRANHGIDPFEAYPTRKN